MPLPFSQSPISQSLPSSSSDTYISSRKDFTIPKKWKPSIMFAIAERQLHPDVRNEIVRDLVTHIYGHVEKPKVDLVTKVAKLLVEKYPFMADSGSVTHVS